MLFEAAGKSWQEYREALAAEVRVLVVDDEPIICRLLRKMLEAEGFGVDTVGTAEAGWTSMQQVEYDLLVVDKNLPDASGVALLTRAVTAGIQVPSVMITAYSSMDSVAAALRAGASDYIPKPFPEVDQVVRRLKSVIDRRLSERVHDRLVQDLTEAVGSEEGRDSVEKIGRELFAFKRALAERIEVVVLETNPRILDALTDSGVAMVRAHDAGEALEMFSSPYAPLAAAVSLVQPGGANLIRRARAARALLEVVAFTDGAALPKTLDAIRDGAADVVDSSSEGLQILVARVRRTIDLARRRHLFAYLIATLYRRAKSQNHPAPESILVALPEAQQESAIQLAAPSIRPGVAPDVEIAELLEWPQKERRDHPRLRAELEVEFHEAGDGHEIRRSKTRDVSLHGMYIRGRPLPVGTELVVNILGKAPTQVGGRVVRYLDIAPDTKGHSGIGVRLIKHTPEYEQIIEDLLRGLSENSL